jgi:hypothetical protein
MSSQPTRTSVVVAPALALPIAALLLGACSLVIANDPGAGPAGEGGRDGRDAAGLDAGVPVDGMVVVPDAGTPGLDGGPMPCASGAVRCEGDTLLTCRDGVETPEPCAVGCGEGRCLAFVPSNVAPDLWDPAAESVDIEEGRLAFDTTVCRAMAARSRIVPQSSGTGPDVCVLQVGDLRIREDATLAVVGSRPLVIMASGGVTIEGTLDVSAELGRSGAGGFRGGTRDELAGGGPTAGGGGEHLDLYADGGGGGGGLCGAGGAGGVGGTAIGGTPGPAIEPSWELVPLVGGGGGGRGRGTFVPGADAINAGLGGAGGGAIQISARVRIRIDGVVLAGGGGGGAGTNSIAAGNYGSGGGGGSGGAILLEAPEVEVRGTLGAAGGAGGGGADVRDGDGEDGDDGVVARLGRAAGGAPGGAFAGRGGDGGGGDVHDGDTAGEGRGSSGNGGGGGGGSGCILVRTETGEASVANTNPAIAPGFRVKRVRAE